MPMADHESDRLMWAASNGSCESCELLIEHGADKTIRSRHGKTAIDQASNDQVAQLLATKGATCCQWSHPRK